MFDLDLIDDIFAAKEYPPTAEQRQLVEKVAAAFYGSRNSRQIIVCTAAPFPMTPSLSYRCLSKWDEREGSARRDYSPGA